MEVTVKLDESELRLIRELLAKRQIEKRANDCANEEWFKDLISRLNPYNEKVAA